MKLINQLNLADEAFLLLAALHREEPNRADFRTQEVVNFAKTQRPDLPIDSLKTHFSSHNVANKAPNPDRYRMFFSTGHGRIRLMQPGDDVHVGRTGRQFPDETSLDDEGRELVQWAKQRFADLKTSGKPKLTLMDFAGCMDGVYGDVDSYVAELREGWEDRP